MNDKAIALRDPATALEAVKSWKQQVANGSARARALKAIQENDRGELHSLMVANVKLKSRSRGSTSPQTLKTYWRGSARLLDWCIAEGLKVYELKNDEIELWLVSMSSQDPPLSQSSQQTYLKGAKAMIGALTWAGCYRKLDDPFLDEDGNTFQVRNSSKGTIKAQPFSDDELNQMLAIANERERALILLGADGGLRVAEMASLRWKGIDTLKSELRFTGKGSKDAVVRCTPRLLDALSKLPRPDGNGNFQVFACGKRRIQQIFARLCEKAEVGKRGIHNLRHSSGTRLYSLTKDILAVKRHLRHSDITSSMIYAHLDDAEFYQAIDKLGMNGIE